MAALGGPSALDGQTPPTAVDGDRIRVTPAEGLRVEGILLEYDSDGLTVRAGSRGAVVLPVSTIRGLEIAVGRKRGKGALVGGALGLVAGAILGGATSGGCAGDCDDPYGVGGSLLEGAAAAEGVVLGALVLGTVGAVAGAVFAPRRWLTGTLSPASAPGR